ncbi:MAG: F0F1 ATP synthase subunit epsilon [Candidatus Korobacteraceae bacterium]
MANTLQLEIVTPERLVVRDEAEVVQIPGKNGYLGILPDHAPLITELGVGQIAYRKGNVIRYLATAWGFAEVLPHKVTILAETAELPEEIDVTAAQHARDQAEKALGSASGEELQSLQAALALAEARLQTASSASRADLANLIP